VSYRILPGGQAEQLVLESLQARENPRWVLHGEFYEVDGQRGTQSHGLVSRWSPKHGFVSDELDDDELPDPQNYIREALDLDSAEVLAELKRASEDNYDEHEVAGEWPKRAAGTPRHFQLARNMFFGFLRKALVTQIPVEESWQIPAYVHFGGWNQCPDSTLQCALWRYWQEKYDAHIVSINHDTIEAFVGNPPQTREDALALAWEQFYYCEDAVIQGTDTVSALAAELLDSDKWFFWWD